MTNIHWGCIFIGILIGYILAMYYPQVGATVKAKIAGS